MKYTALSCEALAPRVDGFDPLVLPSVRCFRAFVVLEFKLVCSSM